MVTAPWPQWPANWIEPTTELRIARKSVPDTEAGWKRWAQEMRVFLTHFGGEGEWTVLKQVEGKGQKALGDAKEIVDDATK